MFTVVDISVLMLMPQVTSSTKNYTDDTLRGGGGGERFYPWELFPTLNPLPAVDEYCRFKSVSLFDQITVLVTEMCVQTSRFPNICAQIKQI